MMTMSGDNPLKHRKEPIMTREEFIYLAEYNEISVEEQNGRLVLSVSDDDLDQWICESDNYKDEAVKWLLSYDPREKIIEFLRRALDPVFGEEDEDFVELWLNREVEPKDLKGHRDLNALLQESYPLILDTYDTISDFVRDLYRVPADLEDEDDLPDPEDFDPDEMISRFLSGPHLGLGTVYGIADVWDHGKQSWLQVDYTFNLPEVITEDVLDDLKSYLEMDCPDMMDTGNNEIPDVYENVAEALSEDVLFYLMDLSVFYGCSVPSLLRSYPVVKIDSLLMSDQTAKGKLQVRIGEETEEDIISFTIPDEYFEKDETDAMYLLADCAELVRPQSDYILDDELYDFFVPRIKEIAAEYLKNHLEH